MKKLLIFIFVVILFSCQKEEAVVEEPNELQTLKIENIKNFLPLVESESKTKVVFYNSEGDEIIFDFTLEEELKDKKVDSKSYFAEEISGSYINESINDYSLYFVGSGNYSTTDASNLFVSAGINQFIEPVTTLLTLNEQGNPVLAMHYDKIQLLDKEFENVYSNLIVPEFNSFSELYYNASYGIIGFKDRQNELYVFKGFVD